MSQNVQFAFFLALVSAFPPGRILAQQNVLLSDSVQVIALLDSAYALELVDSDVALQLYREASRLGQASGYVLGQAKAIHYSGIVHSEHGRYDQASKAYYDALDLYRKIRNTKGVGACYVNIGNLHKYQGRLDSALVYYQHALSTLESTSHKQALAKLYANTGNVFQGLKQYEKALDYNRKSETLARQIRDSSSWCAALVNQGTVWNEMKQYEKAMDFHMRAFQLASKIDDVYCLQLASINLADLYKTQGDFSSAISYGLKSVRYAQQINAPFDVADIKKRVGDLYQGEKKYDLAKAYYSEAFDDARQIGAKEIVESAARALHQLYAAQGDYKNAYHFQSLSGLYGDSILGEKQMKTIHELDIRYQSEKKDKELAHSELQLQESRQQTIYIAAVATIALLFAGLLFVNYRNKKKLHMQRLQLAEREKEKHVVEAMMQGEEKERMRVARSLHDEVAGILAAVKMNLDAPAIHAHVINHHPEYAKAMSLLDEASVTVRGMAHNLLPDILIHHGLDRALQRYCQVMGGKNLVTIQYDSWGNATRYDPQFELAIYRIVQELLNNIIRHAHATEALVQVSYDNETLSITVEDNGVGMELLGNTTLQTQGNALTSLYTRVKYLYGKMDISTEPGAGTSIHLEFYTFQFREQGMKTQSHKEP
ncbi:tetratricopeptide repeat protein [Chryseolinea sp. T2]|uniref:tetratricopeptide repeat-containing sensor histidine kinase n=1 Tax=Chryseolinea sp. T2 TaxID=3129255 RepID=UPI00307844C7